MELGLILFSLVPLLLVVLAVVKYKRLKEEQAERDAAFKMKLEAMTARAKKAEREQDLQREAYRQDIERAERQRKPTTPIVVSPQAVAKPVTPFSATSDTRTMSVPASSNNDLNDVATMMLLNNMMNNNSAAAVASVDYGSRTVTTATYDDTPKSSYSSSYSSSSDDSSSRSSYSSSYSSSSSDSSYSSSSSDSSSFSSD